MKLSQENQELLDRLYPDGYEVKPEEKNNYHILFVKIFKTKGRNNFLNPMVQQMSAKDWQIMKRQLDKGWGLASITGYDELFIIHDPTAEEVVKEEPKAEEAPKSKAKAKPGPMPVKG